MPSVTMLSDFYAECYKLAHYADCRYAELRHAECCYAECRGAIYLHEIFIKFPPEERISVWMCQYINDNSGLYYKRFMIVTYDRNDNTIVEPTAITRP